MKLRTKVTGFIVGFATLLVVVLVTIFLIISMNAQRDQLQRTTHQNLETFETMLHHEFHHHVTLAEAIINQPLVMDDLDDSNIIYDAMTEQERTDHIESLSTQWSASEDDDPFVTDILENELSELLKLYVSEEVQYYGEIFITNKYGVMIGSSGKLSTIDHAHKYWWSGAYNDGDTRVYFDDRGYDNSVGEIVIGVVVPIHDDNGDFVGLIKVNVLAYNLLNSHITDLNEADERGEFLVARASGDILLIEGVEPLTSTVDEAVFVHFNEDEFFDIISVNNDDYFVGIHHLITLHIDEPHYFGGQEASSVDHSGGSVSNGWILVYISKVSEANKPILSTMYWTVLYGIISIITVSIFGYIFSNRFTKDIVNLSTMTKALSRGGINVKIDHKRNDEIGDLMNDFNTLASTLVENTQSIKTYQEVIEVKELKERELIQESRFDALTNLYNRRAFNETMERYLEFSERNNTQFGLVIFDIDDFKEINDTFGHVIGDEVLVSISEKLKSVLRESDIVSRWGGEEFTILIPNTTPNILLGVCEKIRKQIQTISIHDGVTITISLGLTVFKPGDDLNTMMARADEGLYFSKSNGKNQSKLI